ncbi:hypothetical protein [Klebsiella aerogenes]|uniref:hypothetical protein n=1 Tax=Klebsiella aerogenes TaxID=548 RepID=UPI0034D2F8F3
MTDITELALITKIKKQLENFDTVILKEDEALTLVEALEKAQQLETKDAEMVIQISKRLAEAYKRIAELESRTVTVKLPSLNPAMFNGDVMFGYHKAQKEAVEFCAAAGIKVEVE